MKAETLMQLEKAGLVAVIRAGTEAEALRMAEACAAGGVKALEVTFTVPHADQVLGSLVRAMQGSGVLVGAGTVLDDVTCRIAILAGAAFVVSPALDSASVKMANRYAVPFIPGVQDVRTAIEALELGCDLLKLFPGDIVGPKGLKALRGPLPQARFMPTGGVDLENVAEWIAAGAVAVGAGGSLTRGTTAEITARARVFMEKIEEARACLKSFVSAK